MMGLTLIVSDKPDQDRDSVAEAWRSDFGPVIRLGRFWEPPAVNPLKTRVYGADTYCLVLAQKLGLELVSPPDDLILTVDQQFINRNINRYLLGEDSNFQYPSFIKPLTPKLFQAAVYNNYLDLREKTKGLEPETEILVSEIMVFESEARFFIRENKIYTYSLYEGEYDLRGAIKLVEKVTRTHKLPRTVVLDVGCNRKNEWSIIEFNASWGSGLNGCDPKQAAFCIEAAVQTDNAG